MGFFQSQGFTQNNNAVNLEVLHAILLLDLIFLKIISIRKSLCEANQQNKLQSQNYTWFQFFFF